MTVDQERIPALLNRLARALGPQDWWPADNAFEVLVGAVLTQNAAWRNVEQALARLRARDWLTAASIINAPDDALRECIRPSGYYNVKAARLRAACEAWVELGGEPGIRGLPTSTARAALLAVKGLGPESVDDVLLYGFDRPLFVVDAYTRRIFLRAGVIPERISYDALQAAFHAAMPADAARFNEAHAHIVAVGKDYCRPHAPACHSCPLQPDCDHGRAAVQRS
jgi:endonuclease-3 related protein